MHKPIFVLGPGRSFTTVVSAMLGQHPGLYTFPELNLTMADTIGAWIASTPGYISLLRNGVLRSMAQVTTGDQTEAAVADAESWLMRNPQMPTSELFSMLCSEVAPARAIDKSPMNVGSEEALMRLRNMAPDAVYIHLTRHPIGTGNSIHAADWYRPGPEAYDHRGQERVFDPQFYWLACHDRISRFLRTVPQTQQIRVRGEDIMEDPKKGLSEICSWLGLSTDEATVEQMLHPEQSPFAKVGPPNAPYGNDPGFQESPALRPYKRPSLPLSGPLPWRGDGAEFTPEVVSLARAFGYKDEAPQPAKANGFDGSCGALTKIELDGEGMPMAHANLLDNSYTPLPPLLELNDTWCRPTPRVGFANLGSYTGTDIGVSVFDSPDEPALVAIDLNTGETLWQTALDVLPTGGKRLRAVSGILMTELTFEDGTQTKCIFAGNASEIICIGYDGKMIWRQDAKDIGPPRCIRFTQDNALIYGATAIQEQDVSGQVVKLDPLTGETIDICSAKARLPIDGAKVTGEFKFYQSFIVHGDFAWFEGMFVPETPIPSDQDAKMPSCLMRFQVSGTKDRKIYPNQEADGDAAELEVAMIGTVGNRRQGGSPSAVLDADGYPIIVANAFADANTALPGGSANNYQLRAFRDRNGRIETLWTLPITAQEDPTITAAPAIDPVTQTYVAATREFMYVVSDIAAKSGEIDADLSVPAMELLSPEFRAEARAAEVSSPITLCRTDGEDSFIAYIGLAAWTPWEQRNFALMSAIRIDLNPCRIRVLWTGSLALDDDGNPAPALRSFAQPALYVPPKGPADKSGIIMSTMMSGIAVLR